LENWENEKNDRFCCVFFYNELTGKKGGKENWRMTLENVELGQPLTRIINIIIITREQTTATGMDLGRWFILDSQTHERFSME